MSLPRSRGTELGFEKRGSPGSWKGPGEVGWAIGAVERLAGSLGIRGWRRPRARAVPWGAGTRLLRVLPASPPARSESLLERRPESPAPEPCWGAPFWGTAPSHPVRGCRHPGNVPGLGAQVRETSLGPDPDRPDLGRAWRRALLPIPARRAWLPP